MDRLSLHIEYLLLRHDCVVVPGIGAFINVRNGARFNTETGEIRPMWREVRFNSAINHDDGMLANSYARKYRVSFQQGRELVRQSAASLREALQADGEAPLGRLGMLIRDEEGLLSYSPRRRGEMEMRMLGFSPASVSLRTAKKPDSGIESIFEAQPSQTSRQDATLSKEKDNAERRHFDTHRNYYIAINKRFAQVAACMALIIMAAISIYLPASHQPKEDQASVVPVEQMLRTAGQRVKAAAKAAQPAKETPRPIVGAKSAEESTQYSYYLIVATFHNESDAENFIAQRTDSYSDLHTVKSGKIYRVSAKGSNNKEELLSELNSKEFNTRFKEAWIWSRPEK